MIKSLVGAAKTLGKSPALLIPALVTVAIVLGLALLFSGFAIDLIVDTAFLEMVPDSGLAGSPFQFLSLYAVELVALAAFAVISAFIFSALSLFYAYYTSGKRGGLGQAIGETTASLGKAFGFAVFVAVIILFFAALLWAFALLGEAIEVLGAVLTALLGLLAFYLYVKLAFSLQAIAVGKATVKEGLQKSWGFAVGRFWHVLLFLIVLAAINQAIIFVGSMASDLVPDEVLSLVVLAVFWAVSLAFAGLAMAYYYRGKGKAMRKTGL